MNKMSTTNCSLIMISMPRDEEEFITESEGDSDSLYNARSRTVSVTQNK